MLFRPQHLVALAALACGGALAQDKQGRTNPAVPCYAALAEEARFAPLRGKVALSGATGEIRGLTTSAQRPSPQEASLLTAWREAREACNKLEAPYLEGRETGIVATVKEHFASVQTLIGQLQAGAMTYGEFGKRRLELYERTTRRVEQLQKEILPPKLKPVTVGN